MKLHLVILVGGNRWEWTLKLNKWVYGLKQASENWFDILETGLETRGSYQSQFDRCLFYIKDSVIFKYFDDFVVVSQKQETIT